MIKPDAAVPGSASKVDPATLSGQAEAEILRRIESLELAPGAVFSERDLAAELGMTKAPVREALLRLFGTGLVTPRTGSGYTITPVTLRGAQDMFELWALLEEAAVAALVRRGVGGEYASQVRAMFEHAREAPHPPDPLDWERWFHLLPMLFAQNTYALRAFPGYDVARVIRLAARLGHPVACPDGAHDALLDAIERNDPEAPALARRTIEARSATTLDALIRADKVQGINIGEP